MNFILICNLGKALLEDMAALKLVERNPAVVSLREVGVRLVCDLAVVFLSLAEPAEFGEKTREGHYKSYSDSCYR